MHFRTTAHAADEDQDGSSVVGFKNVISSKAKTTTQMHFNAIHKEAHAE